MNSSRPSDSEIAAQCKYALQRAGKRAHQVTAACGWTQDIAGYQSAALLGVARAVNGWRPDGGASFATYCYQAVWATLQREEEVQDTRPPFRRERGEPAEEWEMAPLSLNSLMEDGKSRFIDSLPDVGPSPEEQVVSQEWAREMLSTLSPEQAEALQMRFWDGLSFPEMGARTGRATEGARQRFLRAVDELRETCEP